MLCMIPDDNVVAGQGMCEVFALSVYLSVKLFIKNKRKQLSTERENFVYLACRSSHAANLSGSL